MQMMFAIVISDMFDSTYRYLKRLLTMRAILQNIAKCQYITYY